MSEEPTRRDYGPRGCAESSLLAAAAVLVAVLVSPAAGLLVAAAGVSLVLLAAARVARGTDAERVDVAAGLRTVQQDWGWWS